MARRRIFCVLAGLGLMRAAAHQELYHNIEVDLVGTVASGVVELSFTIHAPELLVGFSEAADAMYDSRWLEGRSDEELGRLIALGREYLGKRFVVRFEGGERLELGELVGFEDFERMRSGGNGLPPACIRATLEVVPPQGARELQFEHAADSEKRLMLVVYRPKAFPVAMDVRPGSRAVVPLQSPPPVSPGEDVPREEGRGDRAGLVVLGVVVAVGILLLGGVVWQLRRAGSRDSEPG